MSASRNEASETIEYLLRLKFPGAEEALSVSGVDDDEATGLHELQHKVEAYRSELQAKQPKELDLLVEIEETRVINERRQEREAAEEAQRFFNQSTARAGFESWCSFPFWTLDQTTALVLGRDPAVVRWEQVEEHVRVSRFARRYAQTRERLKAGDIEFPVTPTAFVNWAERSGLSLPARMITSIRANASPVAEESGPRPADGGNPQPQNIEGPGGHKQHAAREAMLALWGPTRPAGITGYGERKVNERLKEQGREGVSRETCKRAWYELYGPARRGRPNSDPK